MARRLRTQAAQPPGEQLPVEVVDLGGGVKVSRYVRAAARRLVTIGDWSAVPATRLSGALVRTTPAAGATDATIAGFEQQLRELGAVEVKVLPRAAGAAVVAPKGVRPAAPATMRQVVAEVIAAAHTRDRVGLTSLVEQALVEVGL